MKPCSFSLYFSDPWGKFNQAESLGKLLNDIRKKIIQRVPGFLMRPYLTERKADGNIEEGFSGIVLSLKVYVQAHSYATVGKRQIRVDFWQEAKETTSITLEYFLQILERLLPEECIFQSSPPDNLIA
jgi:hypothetical protein